MQEIKEFLVKKNLKYKIYKNTVKYNFLKSINYKGQKYKAFSFNNFSINDKNIDVYFFENLTPEDFAYISSIEKKAILLTKNIRRDGEYFTGSYPIFKVNKIPQEKKFNLNVKEKKIKENIEILQTEIGYGPSFIYILTPIEKTTLDVSKTVIDKLLKIGYPRGFRVKFIFFESRFKNKINELIKIFDDKAVLYFFIDVGILKKTLPIVYKYNALPLFDKTILNAVIYAKGRNILNFKLESFTNFNYFNPKSNLIWIYPEVREFRIKELSKRDIENISTSIYSLVRSVSKYLVKYEYGKYS